MICIIMIYYNEVDIICIYLCEILWYYIFSNGCFILINRVGVYYVCFMVMCECYGSFLFCIKNMNVLVCWVVRGVDCENKGEKV